ncbi:hypothetical protein B0J18DRAFT_121066 [Chaetomium sp. MPI-SDFR-AT-0129]|nr:hypothetical protein B0J18DRAFT_121066 [Chaetomium sp. MPI-SDFR-AT-0129]
MDFHSSLCLIPALAAATCQRPHLECGAEGWTNHENTGRSSIWPAPRKYRLLSDFWLCIRGRNLSSRFSLLSAGVGSLWQDSRRLPRLRGFGGEG